MVRYRIYAFILLAAVFLTCGRGSTEAAKTRAIRNNDPSSHGPAARDILHPNPAVAGRVSGTLFRAPAENSFMMKSGKPGLAPIGRRFLVCIDPGHPSETSAGAHARGLSENTLNWQVAQRLATHLRNMGIACRMTKQSVNEFVTNRKRAEIANDARANLFIRLHCDVGSGRGYTWYYPDRAATIAGVTGPPPVVRRASRRAAYLLNDAMKSVLRGYLRSNPVKTDASTFVGRRQGGALTGSIFSRVPTALIEMCYINQPADARFIASTAGQERMAAALADAIDAYRNR